VIITAGRFRFERLIVPRPFPERRARAVKYSVSRENENGRILSGAKISSARARICNLHFIVHVDGRKRPVSAVERGGGAQGMDGEGTRGLF